MLLSSKRSTIVCRSSVHHKRRVIQGVIKTIIASNPECLTKQTEDCKLMWDTINDLETALNKLPKTQDPLEEFCKEYPEADECRVYDV
jgi:hypothetical protein